MSVGILPGMASYAGGQPAVAADQNANAMVSAGLAAPGLGNSTVGGKLSLSLGSDNTVVTTVLFFAVLYFGVTLAFHQLDRFG